MTSAEFKSIRLRIGWSQYRLEKELGRTRRHIQRLESGERTIEPIIELAMRALADGHRLERDKP